MRYNRMFFAAAMMSMLSFACYAQKPAALNSQDSLPRLALCAGLPDGNYTFSANQIAIQAKGLLNVVVVTTNGSLDNLAKIADGTCSSGIVQADSVNVFKSKNPSAALNLEVGTSLYPEYLHLICAESAHVSKITGLTKDHIVLVGANGGGSSVTWDSFKLADPARYNPVQTLPLGGVRALAKLKQNSPEAASCMLMVSGLKSASLNEANTIAATVPGKMSLVPTNDSDLLKLRTPGKNGSLIYKEGIIPSDTYLKGLQESSFGSNSVKTIAIEAMLVTNSDFVDNHSAEYDILLRAVNNALPAIKKRVEPN